MAGALASVMAANTIVYDNIGESSAGSDGVDFAGPLYDSFTSVAAGQITDLQLMLAGDDTSTGTLEVGLYADDSASPGQLIDLLGSVYDGGLSDLPAVYDITLTSYPLLSDDTRYWIGLYGATTVEWSYDYDDGGIGVADELFSNQMGVFTNDNDPYQMSVTEGAPVTPEPPSILLIVVGITTLALVRRLARRRTCEIPGAAPLRV